jgi:hypothetical protein
MEVYALAQEGIALDRCSAKMHGNSFTASESAGVLVKDSPDVRVRLDVSPTEPGSDEGSEANKS